MADRIYRKGIKKSMQQIEHIEHIIREITNQLDLIDESFNLLDD